MAVFPQPAVPPATAEYVSTLQRAGAPCAPGGAPQQTAYRLFRSSDGKTRVDSGNMSVITDPAANKTIVLDHVKKQAHILPAVPQAPAMAMPGLPQMPALPAMQGAPPAPAVHVQDLGKSFLQGQEVEGKRYTIQPPPAPPMPQLPGLPKQTRTPGIPPAPKASVPVVAEVWNSSRLQLPMATRINSSAGQQTSVCQKALPGEPHPAVFEIPRDYRQILPSPPPLLPGRASTR